MSDEEQGSKIPAGRLSRFARLASLGARTASDLAVGRAKRAMGDDTYDQERAAAKKVLETLGTMKGAAMKLGQQLAMEADALPPEAREIVAKLFAQAPAMSYEDIAKVVEEELDDPPDVVFKEFDKTPLASASLGQVHRAVMKDGTKVAVKVQYPGVAEALANDLKNASLMVKAFGGSTKALSGLDAQPYYEEIRREIGAETDYVREAKLAQEFAAALKDIPGLHVPKVYPAVSSRRVLTMEFVEGITLNKFAATDATEEERWRVGRQLAEAILLPFLRNQFMHADPHPGNFLVRPDGRLTVLDFGAVKKLSPQFASAFRELLASATEDRVPDLVPLLESAGFVFKGDVAKAVENSLELHKIASRPLVQPIYDWGNCQIVPDIRTKFRADFKDIVSVQAPPECIFFYRAIGGLVNNLKTIKAKGSSKEHSAEMLGMRPAAAA